MKSYFEEFEKKYNRPQMNNITVGFSGIDPAPKSSDDGESINEYLDSRIATDDEFDAMMNEIFDW